MFAPMLDSTGHAILSLPAPSHLLYHVWINQWADIQRAPHPLDLCECVFKISDRSEAIWALKAVFYAIDHRNVGVVQLEDILKALSDERWPEGTSASDLPHLRQTTDTMGVSATAAPSRAHDAETLLERLSRLGVGVRSSGGRCNNVDAQGDDAGLVRNIRHLLDPPVRMYSVKRIDKQHLIASIVLHHSKQSSTAKQYWE